MCPAIGHPLGVRVRAVSVPAVHVWLAPHLQLLAFTYCIFLNSISAIILGGVHQDTAISKSRLTLAPLATKKCVNHLASLRDVELRYLCSRARFATRAHQRPCASVHARPASSSCTQPTRDRAPARHDRPRGTRPCGLHLRRIRSTPRSRCLGEGLLGSSVTQGPYLGPQGGVSLPTISKFASHAKSHSTRTQPKSGGHPLCRLPMGVSLYQS
jgi:hypothetical protein